MTDVYTKGPIELRLGDYRDVLQDVVPDAVICDPPYSERTHAGERGLRLGGQDSGRPGGAHCPRGAIGYDSIGPGWAADLVRRWPDVSWQVICCDHAAWSWYESAQAALSRVVFAPVVIVKENAAPRFAGDGPASACEYIAVSRARSRGSFMGSRPGWYRALTQTGRGGPSSIVGSKDPELMRALVRDYSRPGDLVCDPCAGGATTLIAAALEGRRAIGAELDRATWEKACARIERTALTIPLWFGEDRPRAEQVGLGWEDPASEVAE